MAEPVAAGIIGGVSFEEMPGSPAISGKDNGMVATRHLRIAWSDIWTLYAALTDRTAIENTNSVSVADFPGYPGYWTDSNAFKTRLVVSDIEIDPSHDGRVKDITVDNDDMGSYGKADVILTYTTYTEPKRRAFWSTRTSAVNVRGYTFDDSGKIADGESTNPLKHIPDQEIVVSILTEELNPGIPKEASIAEMIWPKLALGSSNSDRVTFWFGDQAKVFPKFTLMLVSYESTPTLRFGKQYQEIIYRFIVAPAYLYIVDGPFVGTTETFPINGSNDAWQYGFSPQDNTFIKMDKSPVSSLPFYHLFPWSF